MVIFINLFKNFVQRRPFTSTVVGVSILGCTAYATVVPKQFKHNVGGGIRFIRSFGIAITISGDYFYSSFGLIEDSPMYKERIKQIHERSAQRILKGCLKNGGIYIKLGQGLCAMNHILPKEYINILTQLQDKCLTREPDELHNMFLEEFGKKPLQIFDQFDETPIAAASLAQVFKAKTKSGEDVAVKVQYSDLQNRFYADIKTIKILLVLISYMHRNFDFSWVFDVLHNNLIQELDFINEGKNSEKCAQDLSHFNYVYVPKVYWDLTTGRILTTEFITAYKISDIEALKKNGFSLQDVDVKLYQAFGEQIFRTGFIHGDPHPGNVFVRKNEGKIELVILDHGLYQQLKDDDRIALCQFWKNVVLRNEKKMKYYSNALGVEDYKMFAEILLQKPYNLGGFKKHKLSHEELNYMTQQAKEHFDKIMEILRSMPYSLILVFRNLNTLRAIAKLHGDPVNRHILMAEIACKNVIKKPLASDSIVSTVKNAVRILNFNVSLWYSSFKLKCLILFFNIYNLFVKNEELQAITSNLS